MSKLLESVIMCSNNIFFCLVLEDIVFRAKRCKVHLRWVPHVVVWVSPFNLIKHRECLLELTFDELVLSLEGIVKLEVRFDGLEALNLVHRKRRGIVQVKCCNRLLSFNFKVLLISRRNTAKRLEFTRFHLRTIKGLKLASV